MKLKKKVRTAGAPKPIQRLSLTDAAPASPFIGQNDPFFSRCSNELMTLSFAYGMGLMDLFNWSTSDYWTKSFRYLTFLRPDYVDGAPTAGHLADPCADPNSFEFGTVEYSVNGFGRYGRMGPVREILKPTRYCETDPRYRLDGSPITDEFEWDLAFILDVMKQDLFRDIIIGNADTPGKFDGLQQLINTDYPNPNLNSMVFDWGGAGMDGTGGGTKTFNGTTMAADTQMVNLLLAIYRRYKQRIMWSPLLATQNLQEGSTVLVMPTFMAECLLDAFTCWSVCPGSEYNPTNLMTYEARNFRNSLLGGAFGAGKITLDGDTIHIFPYDWETMHGSQRGDIYFLTLRVGAQQLWEGEHLNAAAAAADMVEIGHNEYFSTDGGRIIGTTEIDNLCRHIKAWIRPRLLTRAPWLQARIMNVECGTLFDPLSPDPLSSFFPSTSFGAELQTVA